MVKYERFVNDVTCNNISTDLREPQLMYFQTLSNVSPNSSMGIRRIGSILIFLSDGSFMEKICLLERHINSHYGTMDKHMKDFVSDMIDMNTDVCLLAFKGYLEVDYYETLAKAWKKPRKQKLIQKLTKIFQEIKETTILEDNVSVESTSIFYKFLVSNYNNLIGENIRNY